MTRAVCIACGESFVLDIPSRCAGCEPELALSRTIEQRQKELDEIENYKKLIREYSKLAGADEDSRRAFVRSIAPRVFVMFLSAFDHHEVDCLDGTVLGGIARESWQAAQGLWDTKPEDC